MQPDDDVCLCYHVSLRKLVSFARRTRPQHASDLADCLGAGTGCGWCIPVLERIAADPDGVEIGIGGDAYAEGRNRFRSEGSAGEGGLNASDAADEDERGH